MYGFSDDSRFLSKNKNLYDYVSDRCFFDLKANTFVEQDTRHVFGKLDQLDLESMILESSQEELRSTLIKTLYQLLEIFEIHPSLIVDQIKLFDYVVMVEDPELYLYCLALTQNYLKLVRPDFDPL